MSQAFRTTIPIASVVFACGALASPSEARADEPTMKERIEAAARDLPFFAWGEFLHDRLDPGQLPANAPRDLVERYIATVTNLLEPWRRTRVPVRPGGESERPPPEAEVLPLLDAPNPRIRTLALALLFDREELQWLPAIAAKATDSAETFPLPVCLNWYPDVPVPPLETRTTTVGEIAAKMVEFWRLPVPGVPRPSFADWWAARSVRAWSLAALRVRYERDRGRTGPRSDPSYRGGAIVQQIHGLPSPAREVAVLCITDVGWDRDQGAARLERIRAARRLGPDRCLAMLRGEALTDDPDEPALRWAARSFLRDHAVEALRPSDRDALFAIARTQWKPTGWWYAAAAALDPAKADEALAEGWRRSATEGDEASWSREPLAWTDWTLRGAPRIPFLVDWLHDEPKPYARLTFLWKALDRWTPDDRALIAAYVRDPRLDRVPGRILQDFTEALDRNLPEPCVPKDLRARITTYPASDEDPAIRAVLAEWRTAIRASTSRWAPVK